MSTHPCISINQEDNSMRIKTKVIALFVCSSLSIGTSVFAKQPEAKPGNTKLPSTSEELTKLANLESGDYAYSVGDYFERPKQSTFQFSPDGKYISYRQKDDNKKRHIYIKNTETNKVSRVIEEGEDLIRGYGWANESRLIYVKDSGGDENYHLYAVNLDGSNSLELTPFKDVRVSILDFLKDQKDHMIISMNKDNKSVFEPYKINIKTGELKKLYDNTDTKNPIASYDFDKDGNFKAYTKQQNGTDYMTYYRLSEKDPFKPIQKATWKDTFRIIDFNYATENPHDAYVLSNLESDTAEIILYDFAKQKTLKKLFSNSDYDVSGLSYSRKRNYEIDYFSYYGDKQKIVPQSKAFKKIYNLLTDRFDNHQFYITSHDDNEDNYLILVESDKLFGTYYVYNSKTAEIKEIFDLMPQLDPKKMAEARPISYKSRDGLTIHAYLTIPKAKQKGQKFPLIVNPHGGPYGPRDRWGFNPESQLFASRGYATLQINYRGSGGYGKKFFLAGSKQIGRKMLDDLEDGVAYVKSLGIIQPEKIAIYGASYGGLATLGSLVKTPDLYNCGVDYVGVSNLFTFYDSIPPYWEPYLKQIHEQWYDPNNPEEKEIMKQVSPALNIEKITKPLFIVQGANDPRVKIGESDQMVEKLRARGVTVPYMVKYDEGHGFHHEDNSLELYKSMMGFFSQCLK